jgi:hypothetical protein
MSKQQVENATDAWRDVLDAYQNLKDAHANFQTTAEGINPDFTGPGLRRATRLLFHKRRFSMFLEDLLYEDHRNGGVSLLQVPPKTSPKGKKKDKDKDFGL